jgi:hypothetical protein
VQSQFIYFSNKGPKKNGIPKNKIAVLMATIANEPKIL